MLYSNRLAKIGGGATPFVPVLPLIISNSKTTTAYDNSGQTRYYCATIIYSRNWQTAWSVARMQLRIINEELRNKKSIRNAL